MTHALILMTHARVQHHVVPLPFRRAVACVSALPPPMREAAKVLISSALATAAGQGSHIAQLVSEGDHVIAREVLRWCSARPDVGETYFLCVLASVDMEPRKKHLTKGEAWRKEILAAEESEYSGSEEDEDDDMYLCDAGASDDDAASDAGASVRPWTKAWLAEHSVEELKTLCLQRNVLAHGKQSKASLVNRLWAARKQPSQEMQLPVTGPQQVRILEQGGSGTGVHGLNGEAVLYTVKRDAPVWKFAELVAKGPLETVQAVPHGTLRMDRRKGCVEWNGKKGVHVDQEWSVHTAAEAVNTARVLTLVVTR